MHESVMRGLRFFRSEIFRSSLQSQEVSVKKGFAMKRNILWGVLMVAGLVAGYAVLDAADLRNYPACHSCGASRKECGHSRMVVEYVDGTKRADCSLHCVADSLLTQPSRQPKRFQVADYDSRRLIDADKAHWVLYDNRSQCRGSTAELAFSDQRDADRFVSRYGGKVVDFDGALKIAYYEAAARLKSAGR